MWTYSFDPEPLSDTLTLPDIQVIQYAHSPAGHFRTYHFHRHCHVLFCTDGHGFLQINTLRIDLTPGVLAVIPPGYYHACGSVDDSDFEFWGISLSDPENRYGFAEAAGEGSRPSASFQPYMNYVTDAFQLIHTLGLPGENNAPEIIRTQAHLLLELAGQLLLSAPLDPPIHDDLPMQEILRWIAEHYSENITLESMSHHFAMSVSSLSRHFSQAFQLSPIDYLIEYRLNRAADLLMYTDLPVSEIARQVGYENFYYFSNLFSRRIGYSPVDFRRHCGDAETQPVFSLQTDGDEQK